MKQRIFRTRGAGLRSAALAAALPALLTSGCAEMKSITLGASQSPVIEESPRVDAPQAQSLLNYAGSLRSRSNNELNAELELLNRTYAQHRTEDNRLRLAIFHAITPGGDRARALSLLDLPPGENAGRGRNHPIAVLLIPLLQDGRRSEDNLLATQQRLRDEQKRSEALQQKLDAIREIEKKMIERTPAKTP
ncbi:hypothetical protein VVD49_21515 [Uliginosibacterium sp. H3]|uniref:Uncharacterized protein n=1 Tax=Uliginosibacterium silvisoli TaxID=3114758 RepID=A0ABU6K9N3_9RHOO|nr:hypothetical protein [Uliginosibacterium sp. H3]